MNTKICSKCGIEKPFSDFHKKPGGKYGLCSHCKRCRAEYKRKNRDVLRRNDREYQLQKVYGISIERHDELLNLQNGGCPGCGATTFNDKSYHLAVDHDHETGGVRGLLCLKCNRILGLANDNSEILRNLADYLDRSG